MNIDRCYYCDKIRTEQKRVCVDAEPIHDLDDNGKEVWSMSGVYSEVWLCKEHLEELEEFGVIGGEI